MILSEKANDGGGLQTFLDQFRMDWYQGACTREYFCVCNFFHNLWIEELSRAKLKLVNKSKLGQ